MNEHVQQPERLPPIGTAGAILVLVGAVWPAMWVLGSFPQLGAGLAVGPVGFAAILGALGGALAGGATVRGPGAIAGMVTTLGALVAAWMLSGFEHPPGKLTTYAAVVAGITPGLAVGSFLYRRTRAGDAPKAF